MANDVHKIKLLLLWDILCKNTDEDHALNTDEIANLLALRGANVSRKILVQDIATLCDNGYEVLSYKKKYHYYYVVNRSLEKRFVLTKLRAFQSTLFRLIRAGKGAVRLSIT